jgi:hypothetical protein
MSKLDPELEALDAALSGLGDDPVLNELVAAVRAEAPEPPRAEWVESLGRRVAAGFPRARRQRERRRAWATLAGMALVVAVIAVAVTNVGGGSSPPTYNMPAKAPAVEQAPASTASASSQAAAAPSRQVEHDATLALTAPRGQTQHVADRVVQVTDAAGGIVSSSNVTSGSAATPGASFQLLIPSAQLATTLDQLSRLADVDSRTENGNDVTDRYAQAQRRLEDARAERAALLRQLSAATTPGEVASLRYQLGLAAGRISAAAGALAALQQRVSYANVGLTISESSSATGHAGVFSQSLDDAAAVLETSLAVAVVALAACVPFALVLILLWQLRRLVLRRAREAAI